MFLVCALVSGQFWIPSRTLVGSRGSWVVGNTAPVKTPSERNRVQTKNSSWLTYNSNIYEGHPDTGVVRCDSCDH
jgi:hypothetical protein